MIIRYALFEGHIHAGRENEFRAFVKERLVPLWTQFPGAEEVRVLDGTDRDAGAPHYAMALAIRYPDMDGLRAGARLAGAGAEPGGDGRAVEAVHRHGASSCV